MTFLQALRNHLLRPKFGHLVAAHAWKERLSLTFGLTAFTLVVSLALGGGTRGGFLSDTILEALTVPAFLASLSSLLAQPRESIRRAKWALMLCLAIALLPMIQLIPLPPWIWTELPQRKEIIETFNLLGRGTPWYPISVAPDATWLSLLSLLAPSAIFIGTIQLGYRERRLLSLVFVGMAVVEAIVGLIQVAQGPSSPLRFFAVTSDVEAVGFFANTNHFAALMYVSLPFAAAWAAEAAFGVRSWRDRRSLETTSMSMLTAALLVPIVLVGADILTRSRAGLVLMIAAAFGSVALAVADRRRPSRLTPIKLMFGAALVVLLLVVQFGLYRVYEKFSVDPMQDARLVFARVTIAAARAYMPFGSGVGTFVTVYPTFEAPQDTIAGIFANRAHNDWLEMWLEGGVPSMILMAAFVIWFVLACAPIWRPGAASPRAVDLLLARAATMVAPLLMVHSLVDYPLRTGAVAAVFALSCALLVEPLVPGHDQGAAHAAAGPGRENEKQVAPRPSGANEHKSDVLPASPMPRPAERWGEEIEWPDEWRDDRR